MSRTISVILKSFKHMGNHDEYATTAHEMKPGETAEDLVERLLTTSDYWAPDDARKPVHGDWIELRIAKASS